MGQKVNPNGLRLGVNKTWQSNWFADKDYAVKLNNDINPQFIAPVITSTSTIVFITFIPLPP